MEEQNSEITPLLSRHPASITNLSNMPSRRTWTETLQDTSGIVYLLIIVFAMSSWISVNGIWTELPIFVNILPEGWKLPSYLVIVIQIANIGPLIYTIVNFVAPKHVKEWPIIYAILFVGGIASLFLTLFWDKTSEIGQVNHSTALLVLAAVLAVVDCTSSVVYLPYMARFKPQYLTAFYIGEGFSGLIPGVLGLIQGSGSYSNCSSNHSEIHSSNSSTHSDTPRYSVEVYFVCLLILLLVSSAAFTVLHFMSFVKSSYSFQKLQVRKSAGNTSEDLAGVEQTADDNGQNTSDLSAKLLDKTEAVQESLSAPNEEPSNIVIVPVQKISLPNRQLVPVLVLVGWINMMTNGLLPGFQSYTCLPYGQLVYALVTRLSVLASPLASFSALFFASSVRATSVLTLFASALSGYHIALAVLSPSPPLVHTVIGDFLVVTTGIGISSLFSYSKVMLATYIQKVGERSGLLWCGIATQTGSLLGALLSFILVNVCHLLHSVQTC